MQTPLVNVKPPKGNLGGAGVKQARFPRLDEPWPGVPDAGSEAELSAPVTHITTLGNGLKVASEDTYSQLAAFGLYVKCGTIREPVHKPGLTLLLERLAFKSTTTRTSAHIVQLSENLGCSMLSVGDKENIVYSILTLRDNLPAALEMVADAVLNPVFNEEEIDEQIDAIAAEQESLLNNYEFYMIHYLHKVAFANQPLGKSPMDYWNTMRDNISREDIIEYKRKHYVGNRIVLAGASVSHSDFVNLAEKYLGSLPSSTKPIVENPVIYTGGYLYEPLSTEAMNKENFKEYFGLAFKSCGWIEDDSYPLAIVSKILGGGSSFSAGGPGKGMFSRLYVGFMNQNSHIESAEAVLTNYEDNGIISVLSSCQPGNLPELAEGVCVQWMQLAYDIMNRPYEFESELTRAKNLLKSTIFTNLEQRSIIADDIGRQVLVYGKRQSGEWVCNKVDSVTAEDCLRVLLRLFQHPPTVVAIGKQSSLKSMITFEQIRNYFMRAVQR
uniref:Mitochondrial-processing peptidase subunit alpha n=1 Tax=Arcella intermedia TaxID=1963864 RepID=A0A6B2L277_9EUKA